MYVVFFFKQKTAYEMRISDWSSDVCSSDLLEALDRETREALADGFTAKAAIHPAQIPVINAALTPDAEQIAWAEAVLAALDGKGAGRLEGRMVDQPHRRSAIRILARAGRAIPCSRRPRTNSPFLWRRRVAPVARPAPSFRPR